MDDGLGGMKEKFSLRRGAYMFNLEACFIGEQISLLGLKAGAEVCDVGSSSEHYRCIVQPYIDYYIFRPLRSAGARITYTDGFKEPGVDLVVDLSQSNNGQLNPYRMRFDLLIAANIMEHVSDRGVLLDNIYELLKSGGHAIITVPHKFPFHPFPLDTMFRPTADELGGLFLPERWDVLAKKKIVDKVDFPLFLNKFKYYSEALIRRLFGRHITINIYDVGPYEVSCVVVRKK
jgi:SAM-dependent methyltransferase